MLDFDFKAEKSINALLYICNQLGGSWDKYSLLKILYFADCNHLLKFGRPITGDQVIAMEHGPVPSSSYDTIKPDRADEAYFIVIDNIVNVKKQPNMDCFSESEIECIDQSIYENKELSFGALKRKSHNKSYLDAVSQRGLNSRIYYIDIAEAGGATKEFLEYINEKVELTDI